MADTKISALDAAATLTGTEQIPGIQSGGNVRMTAAAIAALAGAAEETRLLRVQKVEPFLTGTGDETGSNLPGSIGSSITLFSDTGPGNVESIQIAMAGCETDATYFDTTVDITVDGVLRASIPMGLLFLYYGRGQLPFLSENLALTRVADPATARDMGGRRALYIPYQTSCLIELTNGGTGTPHIFSQVEYRNGAVPSGRRQEFHAHVKSFGSAVAAHATFTPLPEVTGRGVIDSLQVWAWASATTVTRWLEGTPTVAIDGYDFQYGGTEDFFGIQYYGGDLANGSARCTASRGIPMINLTAVDGTYYTAMYRFLKDQIFDTSAAITMTNGQANQGGGSPPSLNVTSLCIYYLDA